MNNVSHVSHVKLELANVMHCATLKCLIVRWFCGLHIHIKFHRPKLHAMEGTLYHIALPISFSYAA